MKKIHTVTPATLDAELVAMTGLLVTRLWADNVGDFIMWARKNASDHWAYVPVRTYKRLRIAEVDLLAAVFGENSETKSGFFVAFASDTDRLMASLRFDLDTHSEAVWPGNAEAILYLYE